MGGWVPNFVARDPTSGTPSLFPNKAFPPQCRRSRADSTFQQGELPDQRAAVEPYMSCRMRLSLPRMAEVLWTAGGLSSDNPPEFLRTSPDSPPGSLQLRGLSLWQVSIVLRTQVTNVVHTKKAGVVMDSLAVTSKRLGLFVVVFSLVCPFLSGAQTWSGPGGTGPGGSGPATHDSKDFEKKETGTDSFDKGFARVFISLAQKDSVFTFPKDPKSFQQGEKVVAEVVDGFLSRLGKSYPIKDWNVARFPGLPLVVATLAPQELEAVQKDQAVSGVWPDLELELFLDASMTQIGADVVHHPEIGMTGFANRGGENLIVIIDSGFEKRHPMLRDAIAVEVCFSSNDERLGLTSLCPGGGEYEVGPGVSSNCDARPEGCRHGTGVASAAVGRGPLPGQQPSTSAAGSQPSLRGAAPAAGIVAVAIDIRQDIVDGRPSFYATMEQAFTVIYAVTQWTVGVDVPPGLDPGDLVALNLSSGNDSLPGLKKCEPAQSVRDESFWMNGFFEILLENGVAPVIATGNAGLSGQIAYPACLSGAIAVAASSTSEGGVEFVTGTSNMSDEVDLVAPGLAIEVANAAGWRELDSLYRTTAGTSIAAPQVAGAIAAVKSVFRDLPTSEVVAVLILSGSPAHSDLLGRPISRIDLVRAAQGLGVRYTRLEIHQPQDLSAAVRFGPRDGEFISSHVVEFSNQGTEPMRVGLTYPAWLTADGFDNPLAAGSSRQVELRLNGPVFGLPPGLNTGAINLSNLESDFGSVSLETEIAIGCTSAADNDDIANAVELQGQLGVEYGHNCKATTEPDEPELHAGVSDQPDNSVWFRWTAPDDGSLWLFFGANHTARLAVLAFDSSDGTWSVPFGAAISVDGGIGRESRLDVQQGRTYYFAAVGWNSRDDEEQVTEGSFWLAWDHSF